MSSGPGKFGTVKRFGQGISDLAVSWDERNFHASVPLKVSGQMELNGNMARSVMKDWILREVDGRLRIREQWNRGFRFKIQFPKNISEEANLLRCHPLSHVFSFTT
jgi:hypothetical protein